MYLISCWNCFETFQILRPTTEWMSAQRVGKLVFLVLFSLLCNGSFSGALQNLFNLFKWWNRCRLISTGPHEHFWLLPLTKGLGSNSFAVLICIYTEQFRHMPPVPVLHVPKKERWGGNAVLTSVDWLALLGATSSARLKHLFSVFLPPTFLIWFSLRKPLLNFLLNSRHG